MFLYSVVLRSVLCDDDCIDFVHDEKFSQDEFNKMVEISLFRAINANNSSSKTIKNVIECMKNYGFNIAERKVQATYIFDPLNNSECIELEELKRCAVSIKNNLSNLI